MFTTPPHGSTPRSAAAPVVARGAPAARPVDRMVPDGTGEVTEPGTPPGTKAVRQVALAVPLRTLMSTATRRPGSPLGDRDRRAVPVDAAVAVLVRSPCRKWLTAVTDAPARVVTLSTGAVAGVGV